MLKRCFYELQMLVLRWIQRHYLRPRTVPEFLQWYPAVRKARKVSYELIKKHFGDIPIEERIKHDFESPWEMELYITMLLPDTMKHDEAFEKDSALLDDLIATGAYMRRVFINYQWHHSL